MTKPKVIKLPPMILPIIENTFRIISIYLILLLLPFIFLNSKSCGIIFHIKIDDISKFYFNNDYILKGYRLKSQKIY